MRILTSSWLRFLACILLLQVVCTQDLFAQNSVPPNAPAAAPILASENVIPQDAPVPSPRFTLSAYDVLVHLDPSAPAPCRLQVRGSGQFAYQNVLELEPGAEARLEGLDFERDLRFRFQLMDGSKHSYSSEVAYTPDWVAPEIQHRLEEIDGDRFLIVSCASLPDGARVLGSATLAPDNRKLIFEVPQGRDTKILIPSNSTQLLVSSALVYQGARSPWTTATPLPLTPTISSFNRLFDAISERVVPSLVEEFHADLEVESMTDRVGFTLTWQTISLASGPPSIVSLQIERRLEGQEFFTPVGQVRSALQFQDTTVVSDYLYEYRLSVQEPGYRAFSEAAMGSFELQRLEEIRVEYINDHTIDLLWDPLNGISGYRIDELRNKYDRIKELSLETHTRYTTLATLPAGTCSLRVDDIRFDSVCRFRIVALVGDQEGMARNSKPVFTTIPEPTFLHHKEFPGGAIHLNFAFDRMDISNLDEASLERQIGAEWVEVDRISLRDSLVFRDQVPEDVKNFQYRIAAMNGINTIYSHDFIVSMMSNFKPPRTLAFRVTSDLDLEITWSRLEDLNLISGFQLERRGPGEANFAVVGSVDVGQEAFVDSLVLMDVLYEYRIKSLSGSRQSPPSRIAAFMIPDAVASLVSIQGGIAWQGGDGPELMKNEGPAREVRISEFSIGKNEVLNREYALYCASAGVQVPEDPNFVGGRSYFRRYPDAPVVNVSWRDAVGYCNWLSEINGFELAYDEDGTYRGGSTGFRLPTEAEFEFAIRGPGNAANYAYDIFPQGEVNLFDPQDGVAGVDFNTLGEWATTSDGVVHLMGNVWEWTQDWYHPEYYILSERLEDPKGPAEGTMKIRKGGGFNWVPETARVSYRLSTPPALRLSDTGFRLARSVNP